MNRETLKLLKYGRADVIILKKMREEDIEDVFRDSRGEQTALRKGAPYEHFLKASQALNAIERDMRGIYERYEKLYNDGTLEEQEEVLLVHKLQDLKELANEYCSIIRHVDVEE